MDIIEGTSGTSADVHSVDREMASASFWSKRCGWERGLERKNEGEIKEHSEKLEKKK